MDERGNNEHTLLYQIEQLQYERDQLRKDIEQLCMQQAGPSYLAVATRMHFQRTAGLEQEIVDLKKKLAGCIREKQNLQEELSEAYHIKSQLADLHAAEVIKNKEAEKQVKFFQGCVVAAFAERDNSLMEAEKAKEHEEAMSEKINNFEKKLEELESAFLEGKKLNNSLQVELEELKRQSESCPKVVSKFYKIRERDTGLSADIPLLDMCSCLLDDPPERWIYNNDEETSTSKYIASLEEEKDTLRNSISKLQNNLRMGLQIEQHLRRNVRSLETKQIMLASLVKEGLSAMRSYHVEHRLKIIQELDEVSSWMDKMLVEVRRRLSESQMDHESSVVSSDGEKQCDDVECKDVHVMNDVNSHLLDRKIDIPSSNAVHSNGNTCDTPSAFALALQEKVEALLLLSQQEERHMLERDLNKALQNKLEELQRNLSQVTSEKVNALMELAELKRDYELLKENNSRSLKDSCFVDSDKNITIQEQEGKLKNILKKTYLKRWMVPDHKHQDGSPRNIEESDPAKTKHSNINFARLKIENATFQESIARLEHLTSSIRRLHLLLLKAQNEASSIESTIEALSNIMTEAKQMKTVLDGSLPISWSGDESDAYKSLYESSDPSEASKSEKSDAIPAAGREMAELLLLATKLLIQNMSKCDDLHASA
ncbi:myosin-10-like isoform X2 [Zingiber officinale]|uniref:myosin-10-like isoform X2 n=1 Tax=Zingiber officinale TaxID=94328 RepID=UPI001C4CF024|nr:myosin-10-like isoform X2 [Zingiber officinale]